MTLTEFLTYLSNGELSQLGIGTNNEGSFLEEDYPDICTHINLGLTKLYTRFPLKYGEVVIQRIEGRTSYPLVSKYAVNNTGSTEIDRFIIDSVSTPFTDNIISIDSVTSEYGEDVSINNNTAALAVFTSDYRTLLIPSDFIGGSAISVTYQAGHAKLPTKGLIDPEVIEIDIPDVLVEPLLMYVAMRVASGRGSVEGLNTSNQLQVQFESALTGIEISGVLTREEFVNTKFHRNGWV